MENTPPTLAVLFQVCSKNLLLFQWTSSGIFSLVSSFEYKEQRTPQTSLSESTQSTHRRNQGQELELLSEMEAMLSGLFLSLSLSLSPSHSPPPSPSPPSSWLPFIPVFFLLSPNLLSLFNYPTLATLGPWPIIHRVDQVPASATSLCLKPSSCVPANPLRTGVLVSQRVVVKLGSIFLPNQPGNTSITMFYIIVTENLFILK